MPSLCTRQNDWSKLTSNQQASDVQLFRNISREKQTSHSQSSKSNLNKLSDTQHKTRPRHVPRNSGFALDIRCAPGSFQPETASSTSQKDPQARIICFILFRTAKQQINKLLRPQTSKSSGLVMQLRKQTQCYLPSLPSTLITQHPPRVQVTRCFRQLQQKAPAFCPRQQSIQIMKPNYFNL